MTISSKQISRLCAIANEHGLSGEERDEVVASFGYDSKKDIERDDYEEVCEALENTEDTMEEKAQTNGSKVEPMRPLDEIRRDFCRPIPDRLLETKTQGRSDITFIPWYRVQKLIDHYTAGHWAREVVSREVKTWEAIDKETGKLIPKGYLMMTVRIWVRAEEGWYFREGTGLESLDTESWGDFQSNADSMAFRRAAANWGIGINLYEG